MSKHAGGLVEERPGGGLNGLVLERATSARRRRREKLAGQRLKERLFEDSRKPQLLPAPSPQKGLACDVCLGWVTAAGNLSPTDGLGESVANDLRAADEVNATAAYGEAAGYPAGISRQDAGFPGGGVNREDAAGGKPEKLAVGA